MTTVTGTGAVTMVTLAVPAKSLRVHQTRQSRDLLERMIEVMLKVTLTRNMCGFPMEKDTTILSSQQDATRDVRVSKEFTLGHDPQ